MVIAGIRQCSTSDGPGKRFVVLLPGCQHHCTGCQASQGPGSGVDFPLEELLDQMEAQDVEGLSLSGGDPFLQPEEWVPLAKAVHDSGKTVWCWTSHTFEELSAGSDAQRALLGQTDVLVDGPFRPDQASSLPWRTSGNQRCVLVRDSLAAGTAVLLPEA